jgi:hypothetical protein
LNGTVNISYVLHGPKLGLVQITSWCSWTLGSRQRQSRKPSILSNNGCWKKTFLDIVSKNWQTFRLRFNDNRYSLDI